MWKFTINYKITGPTEFEVFESVAEFRSHHPDESEFVLAESWQSAKQGQWMVSDNGIVVKVVKEYWAKERNKLVRMIQTPVGQFNTAKTRAIVLTERLDQKVEQWKFVKQKEAGKAEVDQAKAKAFVTLLLTGTEPFEAFRSVFLSSKVIYDSQKARYVRMMVDTLSEEVVKNMIKEEVRKVSEEMGIGPRFVFDRLKTLSEHAQDEKVQLGATKELGEILDMKPEQDPRKLFPQLQGSRIRDAEFDEIEEDVADRGKAIAEKSG